MRLINKFRVSSLYYYANEYRKKLVDPNDVENTNMTEVFFLELKEIIKNLEILKLEIIGKMRLGKSTIAMALGVEVTKHIKQYHNPNAVFNMNNIARDQFEYSRKMMNQDLCHTVIVTDENSELDNTGENVTIERSLLKSYSNEHAARYVHNINCSPKGATDSNTDIVLQVISTDKVRMISHCKLYYRYPESDIDIPILLGYVNIDVSSVVKNWVNENIEGLFLKPNKTVKEKQKIMEWAKKDWYVEYMIKKHQKFDMLTKHKVLRPRLLPYAQMILDIVKDLEEMAPLGAALTKSLITSDVESYIRKSGLPISIVGKVTIRDEVVGIIDAMKSRHKLKNDIINMESKYDSSGNVKYLNKMKLLEKLLKSTDNKIQILLNELVRYRDLHNEYTLRSECIVM